MAFNYNRVFLAGNLTRDPQVRFFANERAVANFGLAVNRRWRTPEGEQKEETTFVDIEAWGRTAELVGQYLTKGRPCFVEGRLKLDTWEDKDGNRRQTLRVVAETVQFLDPPRTNQPGEQRGSDSRSQDSRANESRSNDNRAYAPSSEPPPSAPPPVEDEPPF